MKRILSSVALISITFLVVGCSREESGEPLASHPAKVSVMGLDTLMTDRLLEHLTRSKRFVPVEREALRRVIEEQRFGTDHPEDFVSKTLEKAIQAMESVEGSTVEAVGALAKFKDVDNDLKDLGTAVGADYLVVAKLEKLENRKATTTAVPYSTSGRTSTKLTSDARFRFRVVDVESGSIVGAASLRSKLTENAFAGREPDSDDLTFIDHLCAEASAKIIDITFPAMIVSVDPLVVSRGTNDGVGNGDRYVVKRKGEEMRDAGGIAIGRLLSPVGMVQLADVNETISTASAVSGGPFAVGDLVVLEARAESVSDPPMVSARGPNSIGSKAPGDLPRVAMGLIKFGATGDKDSISVSQFTDTIISGLSATKRFQMIDRQEVDQLLTEQEAQALASGRDMPSAMGVLKGADYLVYGNVDLFDVQDETITLPNSSRRFEQKVGRVNGNMRVVDARSGDILVSRSIEVEQNLDSSASDDRITTTLAKAYSVKIVEILLNAIYPIKVASVAPDGTLYINRGRDGGITQGETLQAFRPGAAVIDPDTGVQLGVEESFIGSVEIASVEEARSRGSSTPGSELRPGDILRRDEASMGARQRRSGRTAGIKPTLAIGGIQIASTGRVQDSQRTYVADLPEDLLVRLSNTGRFEILERQKVDELLDEKAFQAALTGEDMSRYLQDLSGADYLVYGEVTDFYVDIERTQIEALDEVQVRTTGIANLTLRVVDVSTGGVFAADKIAIRQRLSNTGASGGKLVELLSTAAVRQILERLYPVRVIGVVDTNTVYLNRGEDGDLTVGTLFDLMRPGEEMLDPDTGISFGFAETKVAVLEIVSVEPSRSRATLSSGSTPAVGDIARRPAEKSQAARASKKKRSINEPSF